MKKTFIFTSLFIVSLLLIYSLIWIFLLFSISREFNKQYAGRYINTALVNSAEDYFIKFDKIIPTGFPFKIAFKMIGWTEESRVGKIECLSPIYFGYDLIKQNIYGEYRGEVLAWHKPLESKFGSKVINENYNLTIKIPLSSKLIKVISNKEKNSFEIINFIKEVELKSGRTQIFDLIDQEKLYDQDYKSLKLSFDKRKYYTDLQDLLNNIPSTININQNVKINKSSLTKRLIPPSILFGLNLPFTFSGANKIKIKLNRPKFEDFIKDMEVEYSSLDSSSSIHEAQANIIYKGRIDKKDTDIYLKIDSTFELKKGFFDKLFDSVNYLTSLSKSKSLNNIIKEGRTLELLAGDFIANFNNSTIRELENHQYQLDLDFNLINNVKKLEAKVNDFGIFSGNTGIRLKNDNILNKDSTWNLKGLVSLNNYPLIIDLLLKRDMLGRMKNFSLSSRELYFETTKDFLKTISDHPASNSNNISFDYSINSSEVDRAKIGSVSMKNIKALFDLALYKEALKRINDRENVAEKIKELIPTINSKDQKVLEELMSKPANIDQSLWNELINRNQ